MKLKLKTMSSLNDRIAQFRKMASDDPDNELGHFRLGQLLAEAGNHGEAVKSFERTLELSPGFSKVFQLLGQSLAKAGKTAEAIDVWTRGHTFADERGDKMPRDEMAKLLGQHGGPVPTPTREVITDETGGGFRCTRPGCLAGARAKQLAAPPIPDSCIPASTARSVRTAGTSGSRTTASRSSMRCLDLSSSTARKSTTSTCTSSSASISLLVQGVTRAIPRELRPRRILGRFQSKRLFATTGRGAVARGSNRGPCWPGHRPGRGPGRSRRDRAGPVRRRRNSPASRSARGRRTADGGPGRGRWPVFPHVPRREILLDGTEAILQAVHWGECDATPLFESLSAARGLTVKLADLTTEPKPAAKGGCGTCGSEGGGCSSCGTGGGCSSGSCSKGSVKTAEDLSEYFLGLRRQMEASAGRVPLH